MFTKLHARLVDWYNAKIVKGWYKTWVVWAAAGAVVLPEIINIIVGNLDLIFSGVPVLGETGKANIRLFFLVAIPIIRAIKQKNLPKPAETTPAAPTQTAQDQPQTPAGS